ncbi:MAG: alkaline phosphatase [Paludibacter sp.]|nr:alkaline phosphatase [Paludibacter sp.]
MIGDGMGIAHIYAGMVANGNQLQMERFKNLGFSKTYSSNNFTTDSGAGGTALACGVKTKNGMIGMTPDSVAAESILEVTEKNGLSTGMVTTCDMTHATPASFIAHQVSRKMTQEIAADFLKTDIDVFIGGGRKNFEKRDDNRNLTNELKAKNYNIAYTLDEVKKIKSGKLAGLLDDEHNPPMPERGDMLPDATMAALDILDNNKKGFFLMIEGSQIDWAAHNNDAGQIVKEVLDLDKTIGKVLDYAVKNKNTLVIVTADHETGGFTMPKGNMAKKEFTGAFSTKDHSGVLVPVFAFGPGAENFTGFMENTSFKNKLIKLLKLKN